MLRTFFASPFLLSIDASSADVKPRHHNGSGHSPDSSLDARRGSEGTEYGPLTLPFSARWRRRLLSMDDPIPFP